jgi:preprotein translocase subunit YajC
MSILTIFADAAAVAPAADPAAAAGGGGIFGNPLFLVGLMALFFFVVIWPAQRRQKREAAEMLTNMKNGSKVIASGGIVGTIVKIADGDDEVVIRSEDTKLRILRSSIVRVVVDKPAPEAAK